MIEKEECVKNRSVTQAMKDESLQATDNSNRQTTLMFLSCYTQENMSWKCGTLAEAERSLER